MYRAVVFDLDGTLVQTEKLKAISYARAASELSRGGLDEAAVVEEFKKVVGRSRQEVSTHLMKVFDLEERARGWMADLGAERPWQAFARLRLGIYEKMIADANVLREHRWPGNIALLERVRKNGFKTALATMSYCREASRVLEALSLRDSFDFVAARDDVEKGKPDPEIYLLCASELAVPPEECLVIEDSPAGVRSAQAAGMDVLAVTTPFTKESFRTESLLDRRWVVDDPEELPTVMWERLLAHQRDKHDRHGG